VRIVSVSEVRFVAMLGFYRLVTIVSTIIPPSPHDFAPLRKSVLPIFARDQSPYGVAYGALRRNDCCIDRAPGNATGAILARRLAGGLCAGEVFALEPSLERARPDRQVLQVAVNWRSDEALLIRAMPQWTVVGQSHQKRSLRRRFFLLFLLRRAPLGHAIQ